MSSKTTNPLFLYTIFQVAVLFGFFAFSVAIDGISDQLYFSWLGFAVASFALVATTIEGPIFLYLEKRTFAFGISKSWLSTAIIWGALTAAICAAITLCSETTSALLVFRSRNKIDETSGVVEAGAAWTVFKLQIVFCVAINLIAIIRLFLVIRHQSSD